MGTRLLPLTSVFPKELLPINGKPGIEYILDECLEAGIKEIIFIISKKKEMIRDFKDIDENELVIDVARIMEEEKIYSLIVKNSKNSITGIIRMHEILSAKII